MSNNRRKKEDDVEVNVDKEKVEVQEKEQVENQEETHPLIYVGPSIPGEAIRKNALFSNGVPKHLVTHFDKCKEFEKLFVPVNNFPNVEQELKDPTSPISVFYKEAESYFRKG